MHLKTWSQRRTRDLGQPSSGGSPPPLIDCVHKLMQLWKSGEQSRVDTYLEARGLWRHEIFARVVQAITELAERGSDERKLLESVQTHLRTHGGANRSAFHETRLRRCVMNDPHGGLPRYDHIRSAALRRFIRIAGLRKSGGNSSHETSWKTEARTSRISNSGSPSSNRSCAEAYQLAGAVGAPEKVLDNLAAAAQGVPIPHATFLPVSAADCDETVRADTPAAISGRATDTPCCD